MSIPESAFHRKFQPDYTGMCLDELSFCTMKNYRGAEETYKMDLIRSAIPATQPQPVVLFIHGGGFLKPNDKRQAYISIFAKKLTESGYAVVSPDYPQFENEEQLAAAGGEKAGYAKAAEAIHNAYQFLQESCGNWNLDTSRIAIIGGSAGGMAAFYAISGYRDHYRAFVNCWGAPKILPDVHAFPATLSIHGTEDSLVPYSLEEAIQKAFVQQNVPHRLITLPGCGHTPLDKFTDFMPAILEWLNANM